MGGGDDGGYQARQDKSDRDKQRARNALNAQFGVAPTTSVLNPADFQTQVWQPGGPADQEGGGGSGAGGFMPQLDQAAYDAAVAAEAAQGAEAAKNKAALDALYGTVRNDAFTAGKRRLEESKSTAGRDLKFELFARGLNGGSVDVDQNALLGRTYAQGITDLGGKADSALSSLKAGDENARLTLLQSIDNGMDSGSALSSALAQMRNNSEKASSEAVGTDLGNLFANSGLLYDQGRRARGERTSAQLWQQYGGGSRGGGGSSSPSGALTFSG